MSGNPIPSFDVGVQRIECLTLGCLVCQIRRLESIIVWQVERATLQLEGNSKSIKHGEKILVKAIFPAQEVQIIAKVM